MIGDKAMKKLLLTITLIFCGMTSFAQSDYSVIKGNVAEKNVNITIINTSFGVSSDDKGDFIMMLPKMENKVGLLFSCIGYEDTLVSVIPNRDTININFKMKGTSYMLDAVGVGADKMRHYSEPSYVICDFEIYDDKVFILQRKWNTLKECRILVQDLWLDPIDTISIPKHIEPERLFLDGLECLQMLGRDTVYQIVREDYKKNYIINYPTEKNHYAKVMNNIIFMTNNHIYFRESKMDGYVVNFFRIGFETKKKEMLMTCDDMKTYEEIKKEVKWHKENLPPFAAYPSAEEWEVFVSKSWYHTKDNHLDRYQDTLYYFDHFNSKILTYDENMNLLNECEITYPTKEDFWQHKIYKDKALGKFYTIFGSVLNEIDVATGKTTAITNADSWLTEKIIIYKGTLYSVTKNSNTLKEFKSYIERIEL